MAIFYNTRIVRNGLTMHLDTANVKSYNYSENLLTYSQQFTNAAWSANSITAATTSTTAPDGTLTANYLIPSATNSFHQINNTVTLNSGTTYTYSVYVKPAGYSYVFTSIYNGVSGNVANQKFNLVNGTVDTFWTGATGTPSINLDANGWYRIAITATIPTTGSYGTYIRVDNSTGTTYIYTADGISGLNVWGGQVQQNPYVGKYTPTTNTTVIPSTTWTDLSGQGNNATLINAPVTTATSGGIILNGTNQYANVANSFVTTATYTKSIWFNISNLAATNNLLSNNTIFWLSGSNVLRASDTSQANYSIATGSIPLSTSTWYNGVVTYNSLATTGTWKLYVNGVLDTTTYANSNPALGNIQVGAFGSGNYFQGQLACPMIYNRVLSDDEVKQNFQALRDRFGV